VKGSCLVILIVLQLQFDGTATSAILKSLNNKISLYFPFYFLIKRLDDAFKEIFKYANVERRSSLR